MRGEPRFRRFQHVPACSSYLLIHSWLTACTGKVYVTSTIETLVALRAKAKLGFGLGTDVVFASRVQGSEINMPLHS